MPMLWAWGHMLRTTAIDAVLSSSLGSLLVHSIPNPPPSGTLLQQFSPFLPASSPVLSFFWVNPLTNKPVVISWTLKNLSLWTLLYSSASTPFLCSLLQQKSCLYSLIPIPLCHFLQPALVPTTPTKLSLSRQPMITQITKSYGQFTSLILFDLSASFDTTDYYLLFETLSSVAL